MVKLYLFRGSFVLIVFLFVLSSFCLAKEDIAQTAVSGEEVVGTVNGIGKDFISVIYRQKKNKLYAMSFKIDDGTAVINKKSLGHVERGDTVAISYEQIVKLVNEEPKLISRVARAVNFIDQGAYLDSRIEAQGFDPEDEMVTDLKSDDSLSIKGFKSF